MLKSLKNTNCFKRIGAETNKLSHAYLLYGKDRCLNNQIAELFATKIFCELNEPCFNCEACKKMELEKNPDFIVVDKQNVLVEDIMGILDSATLKPMIYKHKVILIKNAENINELGQNKLLKTLEEPNDSTIFILTSTNEEKLLTTVKSRVKKLFLNFNQIEQIKDELLTIGLNPNYISNAFSLTEAFENSQNKDYADYVVNVENLFSNLKTTQDIPKCVAMLKLTNQNKMSYIEIFAKLFKGLKTGVSIFNDAFINGLKTQYNSKLIITVQALIEDAYTKLSNNVNANYVFDNLLYTILKEKYLCK